MEGAEWWDYNAKLLELGATLQEGKTVTTEKPPLNELQLEALAEAEAAKAEAAKAEAEVVTE